MRKFSFSNLRLKSFSVGQMSIANDISWDIFSLWDHKVGSSSHCCDTIFLVSFCYEQHSVFILMHSILYSHPLCILWVFVYRWCIVSKGINTKSFTFLSFIMILISFCCYLWSFVFENEELGLSSNPLRLYVRMNLLLEQRSM